MTKFSINNGNERKSDIFSWDILIADSISFFYLNLLKYFNVFKIGMSQFYG